MPYQDYIYYDQENKKFRAWRIEFGSWEHSELGESASLPQLEKKFPDAHINESTYDWWDLVGNV